MAIRGGSGRRLCSYVDLLWDFICDPISALEPAIDLSSRPDIRNVEDFGINREDNSIVAHSSSSAICTDQRFREPRGLRFRCNSFQLFLYAGLGIAVKRGEILCCGSTKLNLQTQSSAHLV